LKLRSSSLTAGTGFSYTSFVFLVPPFTLRISTSKFWSEWATADLIRPNLLVLGRPSFSALFMERDLILASPPPLMVPRLVIPVVCLGRYTITRLTPDICHALAQSYSVRPKQTRFESVSDPARQVSVFRLSRFFGRRGQDSVFSELLAPAKA